MIGAQIDKAIGDAKLRVGRSISIGNSMLFQAAIEGASWGSHTSQSASKKASEAVYL